MIIRLCVFIYSILLIKFEYVFVVVVVEIKFYYSFALSFIIK